MNVALNDSFSASHAAGELYDSHSHSTIVPNFLDEAAENKSSSYLCIGRNSELICSFNF